MPSHAGNNGLLLNGRGLLKPIGVDASEQLLAETHVVKVVAHLVPVGLDDADVAGVIVVAVARGVVLLSFRVPIIVIQIRSFGRGRGSTVV